MSIKFLNGLEYETTVKVFFLSITDIPNLLL